MPTFNTKISPYNPAGEAARREQQRNADLDRIERNKEFPTVFVQSFGFRPYFSGHDTIQIKGPLCPSLLLKDRQCLSPISPLDGENEYSRKAHCDVCGKDYEMPFSFQKFKEVAHKAYEGFLNSQTELITLDVPYGAIKAESKDDTREIKIVWSQKDGRNQAIVYLLNRDGGGEKSHMFIDLDRQEIRHDPSDKMPGEILAKIVAEFRDTVVDIRYKSS
jgi:hypothetical protein